jgi:hypothetical protein
MTDFAHAVIGAEKRIFTWLCDTLQMGQDGVTAFRPQMPRTFSTEAAQGERFMWEFRIRGDGIHVHGTAGAPFAAQHMLAVLEGVFDSRDDAWEFYGTLHDNLPTGDSAITGIIQFATNAQPTCDPDVLRMGQDQDIGGDVQVWRLTIPLYVVFSEDAQE